MSVVESMLMEYQLGDIVKRQEGQIGFHEGLCAATTAAGVGDDEKEERQLEAEATEEEEAADTSAGPILQSATCQEGGSETGVDPSSDADVGSSQKEQAAAAPHAAAETFGRPNIVLRLSRECTSSPSMLTEVSGVLSGGRVE